MNDGFKQRLVGAVVLGSLILILWPVVFTQTSGPQVDKRSQIPERPSFEKYTVAQPTRPQGIEPMIEPDRAQQEQSVPEDESVQPQVQQRAAHKTRETEKIPVTEKTGDSDEKPKLDKNGLPISWALQVASFSQHSNAVELKRSLQKKGYKAYTRRVKTQGKESVRVYVGPKLTKSAFADDKKAIDKAFKVNSLIVRFVQ